MMKKIFVLCSVSLLLSICNLGYAQSTEKNSKNTKSTSETIKKGTKKPKAKKNSKTAGEITQSGHLAEKNKEIMIYPETKIGSVIDDYHGTKVADPYRWLEDDNSTETKNWVQAQNKVTFDYLDKIPFRQMLRSRLEKLWNYERFSSPFKEGEKYYYYKNNGLQNQSVIYATTDLSQEGEIIMDPNTLSKDGTAALGAISFSKDSKFMAYIVNKAGSDWGKISVMNLETKQNEPETLDWIKFSGISWRGNGFYYSRYPAPKTGEELSKKNEYHSVYYHTLGTTQEEDELIFRDIKNPLRNAGAGTTEDERFLILSTSESTSGNSFSFKDLSKNDAQMIDVITTFNDDYNIIDNDGDILLVMTNANAPKNRVVAIDTKSPQKENWKTIIPESSEPLSGINIAGGKMFATYMKNASTLIKVFDLKGNFIKDLELPGIGTSGGVGGKKKSNEAFYSFTSFTQPNTIYSLNTDNLESKIFRSPKVDFDPSLYETTQEWVTSKDGTKVPIFITKKKTVKLDGNNPTLLYGYGGFDVSLTPSFTVSRLPFLEQGGIYVMANLRGGGEFGKEWHKAGTLDRKQNVFDDFIAAAEYLIGNKYTSTQKLAIQGGSNGGLLVGACMTQRPDLFAVAFPAVGVMDMLRYHNFTIGWAWASDYGRSDDAKMFPYLYKYSPLHNVKPASYPATMVTTADHDDRVVPAHSFKFAAQLQKNQKGPLPALIRIDVSAGHGAGKPTSKQIDEAADIWSFLLHNVGAKIVNM
jgi:prolyl oligopeptidase